MSGKQFIDKEINNVIDTIRNPSGLATGDAVKNLLLKIAKENIEISADEVVSLLKESGLSGADILKGFIEVNLDKYRKDYKIK